MWSLLQKMRGAGSTSAARSDSELLTVEFAISGMHCTSCSMNIDGELEDTPGVVRAETSYAQARTVVRFDERVVTSAAIAVIITDLGYTVSQITH